MSGGSLDYAFDRLEDAASSIENRCNTALHMAFSLHLRKVAKALHDVEWVLSGDYGEGGDIDAMKSVVTKSEIADAATKQLESAIAQGIDALRHIREAL